MMVKSLMSVQKKLHKPTKDLTILMLVGGCVCISNSLKLVSAWFDALRCEHKTKVRDLPNAKKTFVQLTLRWF